MELMEDIHIADLKPELPALDSKQVRGVVTLIWPYSSSARQFAFLLGDPDFRLRRKKGQVRVRFSGSSARAIASTGVGIGDELVLSLRGAEFVKDSDVSTPGKSVDWELAYTQTLCSRIVRNGGELATLDLVDAAPTPAPRSPVRPPPRTSIESSSQWSSPAFLKRIRLSDGPVLQPALDPFTDDLEDAHAKKRRRRSYRDWGSWTYLARTPSPEKEDADTDGYEYTNGSPIRRTYLPDTPLSPPKIQAISVVSSSHEPDQDFATKENVEPSTTEENTDEEEKSAFSQVHIGSDSALENVVRDADYYDLYAGPDEQPPDGESSDDEHIILEGDTEPNTEGEDESDAEPLEMQDSSSAADVTEEAGDVLSHRQSPDLIEASPHNEAIEAVEYDTRHFTDTHDINEIEAKDGHAASVDKASDQQTREPSETHNEPILMDNGPRIVMPPPALSLLQTSFQNTSTPGMLTPIGKEPSSPNLRPQDSSTLPMPSPFPGERDGTVTSYLDYVGSSQQTSEPAPQEEAQKEAKQQQPDTEADYIMETSFYSSVNSSHAPSFHESAFTDLRFNFGLDGTAFSRPQTSSGEERPADVNFTSDGVDATENADNLEAQRDPSIRGDEVSMQISDPPEATEDFGAFIASSPIEPQTSQQSGTTEVVVLSSSSEVGDAERDEQPDIGMDDGEPDDDDAGRGEHEIDEIQPDLQDDILDEPQVRDVEQLEQSHDTTDQLTHDPVGETVAPVDNDAPGLSTQLTAVSEVIDLGSPSDSSEVDEESFTPVEASTEIEVNKEKPGRAEAEDIIDQEQDNGPRRDGGDKGMQVLLSDGVDVPQNDSPIQQEQIQPSYIKPEPTGDVEMDAQSPVTPETLDPFVHPGDDILEQDTKLESIEEPSPQLTDDDQRKGNERLPSEGDSELLIAVPEEEGHKLGGLQFISVPDTAPARNTRSKTKASMSLSMSPEKEAHVTPQTTRSRKRTSLAPLSQRTVSPPAVRARSTATPTRESILASPYSLRSQFKNLSPTKPDKTSTRQRSRQAGSSVEPSPQRETFTQESLLSDGLDFPFPNFGPSQELGTLRQGKFANVPYVKDSEEGSTHSENSLSTIQYSDDWNMGYTTFSDPVNFEADVADPRSTPRKAPAASRELTSPETPVQKGPRVSMTHERTPSKSASPYATQLLLSSPAKSVRSTASLQIMSSSPRRSRRINKELSDLAADADMSDVRNLQAGTQADDVIYPSLPALDKADEMESSPSTYLGIDESTTYVEDDRQIVRSPRAGKSQATSVHQQSMVNSNLPMTPEATQQMLVDSQPSFPVAQEKSLPMTPQLTQSTSAALRTFQSPGVEMEAVTAEPLVKPSPITKRTPRRNITAIDVASASASPRPSIHSASSPEPSPTMATTLSPPSVGLSTPIAYYTPLKDLPYFLNRSSSFHTSGSPDILALITQPSTPPSRATKGPKHHNTTLHITDLSTFPSQTTVQFFRAFADALPVAHTGDVILIRAFSVRSLNRKPCLVSGEESAWCVWRWGKPVWGRKRGVWGEVRAREEVKGPEVERGEGEWGEVERLRGWFRGTVKGALEEKERSKEKEGGQEIVGS